MDRASRGGAQLLCALAILAVLGGALALAVGSRGADAGAEQPADSDSEGSGSLSARQVARISVAVTPGVARRVERLRELEFDHLPEPEVVSARYLNRLGLRELERQRGRLGLGADEAVGRITGMLASDEQLEAAYESTGDLAAAAYDTRTERLYVVKDAAAGNRELIEFLLSHELDHALEDQVYGLPNGGGLNDDSALARQALVEGLATTVMVDYAALHLSPLSLFAGASEIDAGTGGVPKEYVDQLTWTYLGGNEFIAELRRIADGWKLIDYALSARPPATTEQVLHPVKYLRDERPASVRIDGAPLRRRGWRPADRNVLGELATSELLGLGGDKAAAERAAAGWDGDLYELWRRAAAPGGCASPCRGELALVMAWRWDSAADARQFERAVRVYVEEGLDGEAAGAGVWTVRDGAVALSSGDEGVALVFAPDRATARATADAQPGA